MLSSNTRHCAPLERGDWTHHDSIDMALLWSEKHAGKERFLKPVIDPKTSVTCWKNYSDKNNGTLSTDHLDKIAHPDLLIVT